SRFQETLKPILVPLVTGERTILSLNAQRLLAGWCAMSVMTADFFYPDRQAIPQVERDYFRDNLLPPLETWKIWIGRYTRKKWAAHYIRNSMPMVEDFPEGDDESIARPNSQMTTIVVGQLYIHAFSCPFPSTVAGIATIPANGFEKIAQI